MSPCLLQAAPPKGYDETLVDSPMYHDPDLRMPRELMVFPEHLRPLWLEALRRPEADVVCKASYTIALAHRYGMKGLDSATGPLLDVLDRPEGHASIRLEAARALIQLDDRDGATRLFRAAQSGGRDLRALVEPALARWDYRPARVVWLERLAHPDTAGADLVLAVRGLAAVHEDKAAAPLRELVLSRQLGAPLRLEVARALGVLRTSGLEPDARRLLAGATPRDVLARVAAASLLRHHGGVEAIKMLQELGRDPEPAVAVSALARLLEIDPKLLVHNLITLLASPDAGVRSVVVDVLYRLPSDDNIPLLADQFKDPHPAVRVKARRAAGKLAGDKAHREVVLREAMRVLGQADWRGQEQAAILLTQMDHKPAAERLAELLSAARPEVFITAAWGLRRMAVPGTLKPVLAYMDKTRQQLKTSSLVGRHVTTLDPFDVQLCQLCQFLGKSRYGPADGLLRSMIPRLKLPGSAAYLGDETRAATVWALGLIHEGKPVPEVDQALVGRLTDVGSMLGNEEPLVRRMCAISLGRMKAKETLPVLERYCTAQKATADQVNNACGWAIEQLTGRKMGPPGTMEGALPFLTAWLNAVEPKK